MMTNADLARLLTDAPGRELRAKVLTAARAALVDELPAVAGVADNETVADDVMEGAMVIVALEGLSALVDAAVRIATALEQIASR